MWSLEEESMTIMTADLLVKAVQALELQPGGLVSATDITEWCRQHGIDYGPPVNSHFLNADLKEAGSQHRLLKFKTAPSRAGRNFFARRLDAPRAPGPASGHPGREEALKNGWVECAWIPPWGWKNAQVPLP
jgi:hypothetical protein